jgi:branched-subunit amino acid ABC-type transport system permease component
MCKDWLQGYTLSNAIVQSTAILILVLNIIIVTVLKLLSQFQRFHTMTEEKASSIVKMFLIQLINTGIVILLVNARILEIKLPDFIPLFQGKYEDFTVEWYRVVGSTISFTMLINIITPHTGAIIGVFVGGLKKCCDRGCSCDKRRTKARL